MLKSLIIFFPLEFTYHLKWFEMCCVILQGIYPLEPLLQKHLVKSIFVFKHWCLSHASTTKAPANFLRLNFAETLEIEYKSLFGTKQNYEIFLHNSFAWGPNFLYLLIYNSSKAVFIPFQFRFDANICLPATSSIVLFRSCYKSNIHSFNLCS